MHIESCIAFISSGEQLLKRARLHTRAAKRCLRASRWRKRPMFFAQRKLNGEATHKPKPRYVSAMASACRSKSSSMA